MTTTHNLRLRPRHLLGWLTAAQTIGTVTNGLRLRTRISRLEVIDPAGRSDPDSMVFVTAQGVDVDDLTRQAAVAHADTHGLDVLDLVPADLPIEQLLMLARGLDPSTYRTAPLALGTGAFHAIAVRPDVLQRAEIDPVVQLDPVQMVLATVRLKQFAPRSTNVAVSLTLQGQMLPVEKRMSVLRAQVARAAPVAVSLPLVLSALRALTARSNPTWSMASAAASATQPLLATSGTALHPADLSPSSLFSRVGQAPMQALRTFGGGWQSEVRVPADPRATIERRADYTAELAQGTRRFFEPRRSTCPMCDGADLVPRIENPDLLQHKPGRFVLESCSTCGHVFQNPRLSIEGLDFYYRDFYDGLGESDAEGLFAATDASYRGRAQMVARVATPKRWLDVGAGHGHFCLIATEELPTTRFDGLDMSESIDEAVARGWVESGVRGMFPEVADQLAGAYDVVSMHHYLEHTREPLAELDAAHTVLEPGGLLLIELPNPESAFGRWLGRYWIPWFQPQHQHFLSIGALGSALEARGFEVVATEIGPAHQPVDMGGAVWMAIQAHAPKPDRPWLSPPTLVQRLGRSMAMVTLVPIAGIGLLADLVLASRFQKNDAISNTYRLLARRID